MNVPTSVEVIKLLYSLQQIELGDDPNSEKNVQAIKELREKVPPMILGHYDRLMKRGKKGVAIVRGTNCPECHMTLPSGTCAQLRRAEDIVLCDTCARYLLYIPEENTITVTAKKAAKAAAPKKRVASRSKAKKTEE